MAKPQLEVADVLREYGDAYRNQYGFGMSPEQRRVMRAVTICRTAALGGHVDECGTCGHQAISYNSCRNRHCPKCQSLAKARWLEERQAEILPVDYHHVVFTLPEGLAPLALQNKRTMYTLLFQAASRTLLTIASDPKHLGAQIGFLAILHTWGQTLTHHPHVHCVVPGGGLSKDGRRWVSCRENFFLPVRVLSCLFRRLFLESLEQAFRKGTLAFHGNLEDLAKPERFKALVQTCCTTNWVVYSKPPFGGPRKVLDYLGRYTHRIAISNHRLRSIEDGKVSFAYKDYKHGATEKIMTLDADEFIRRFLMHVLPDGFVRIRHYGFLANCHRTKKLQRCRELLHAPQAPADRQDKPTWKELLIALTGQDPGACPQCEHGRMTRIETIEPTPYSRIRSPPEDQSW